MATYTENYNLEKPAQSDLYNIDVFNENADKIDEALGGKAANQSLAPIESTSTATRNYSVGQQFVYNGLLYEATSAIASGGTITPGTNCARTTVAEELSALNDSLTHGLFKLKSYSFSYNLSAGADFSTSFEPTETGYYALGIVRFSTNNVHVLPVALNLGSGTYAIALHNVGTSAKTGSLQVIVLFYKGTVTWVT